MFPNLGYKKDTFLEPSLVSNNFFLHPITFKQDSFPHLNTMSQYNNNHYNNSSIFPRGPGDPSSLSGPAVPGRASGPNPLDGQGRSTRTVQEGGELMGHVFVTARGDRISNARGYRPQQGWIGGPYPRLDQVSKRI